MASVASQLIEEVTAHARSNSLEDAREICADGTYFPNNLRILKTLYKKMTKIIFVFNVVQEVCMLKGVFFKE